jgi:hypothetical protein
VHLKCRECAAGWWHGTAIPLDWWLTREQPTGIRLRLRRWFGEPTIYNGNRKGR